MIRENSINLEFLVILEVAHCLGSLFSECTFINWGKFKDKFFALCPIGSMVTKEVTNFNIYFYFNLLAILDLNRCYYTINRCSVNAQCVNPLGTYESHCVCDPGFLGNLCQCKFFCRITNMLQKLSPITWYHQRL